MREMEKHKASLRYFQWNLKNCEDCAIEEVGALEQLAECHFELGNYTQSLFLHTQIQEICEEEWGQHFDWGGLWSDFMRR